jgi:hypothetical protein
MKNNLFLYLRLINVVFQSLSCILCCEIGYILRSLGQNPTEDNVLLMVCNAGCTWDSFLTRQDKAEGHNVTYEAIKFCIHN